MELIKTMVLLLLSVFLSLSTISCTQDKPQSQPDPNQNNIKQTIGQKDNSREINPKHDKIKPEHNEIKKDNSNQDKTIQNKVYVYYFHGNFRCPTCRKIERYSKEAVEQYFKKEIDDNKLVFKAINYEEKENEHFAKDYQLYTRSLVISLVKGKKETEWKNLEEIWTHVVDKQKFHEYVKEEVSSYLKELK